MCYIWAFLSKHHPAAAHEMPPQRGRQVEVLERGTSRSQLSRLHLNAETFALFWLTAAKKKWICPLWFCGSLQRSSRETFHWTYSLIYWTMLTRDFPSVGWEKTRQVTLCFLYVGERNELPDERLMDVSALPLKINCVFRLRQQFSPTKCRGAEMSQSASADESWLCPMTRLRGQRLGRGDVTLHLHHHGDTSFPHPTWAGWRLRNVLMAFLTAWPGADSRWLRVSTGF